MVRSIAVIDSLGAHAFRYLERYLGGGSRYCLFCISEVYRQTLLIYVNL